MSNESGIVLVKVLERRHAEALLAEGQVHFSKPISWYQKGISGELVRGDVLEGCFAATDVDNFVNEYVQEGVETFEYKGLRRYRRLRTVNLPTFCLYGLSKGDFDGRSVDKLGEESVYTKVPARFFESFATLAPKSPSRNNSESEMAVVLIFNPEEFVRRIVLAVKQAIASEGKVLVGDVSYIDDSVPHCIVSNPPYELFFKSNEYAYQHEKRCVLDIEDELVERFFDQYGGNLELGYLGDIARLEAGYYQDDLMLAIKGQQIMYQLSKPETIDLGNIHDMGLAHLLYWYVRLVDFCSRYDDEENEKSRQKFEDEISARTGATGFAFDPASRVIHVEGALDEEELIEAARIASSLTPEEACKAE